MQVHARLAIACHSERHHIACDARGEGRHIVFRGGHAMYLRLAQHSLHGDVQADQGERHARPKYHLRGFGIDPDIELRGRGRVAGTKDRAAHADDAADALLDLRFGREREGDVGKRSLRDERDGLRCAQQALDQEAHGIQARGRRGAERQVTKAAEPIGAMTHPARPQRAQQGCERAGGHWQIAAPRGLQDLARVERALRRVHVSRGDGQRLDVQLGRAQREQDRQRIVHAGVSVDDDRDRH